MIVRKQLLVVVNTMCGIESDNKIKENMLDWVMWSTTVLLGITFVPEIEGSRLLGTTYNNLHMWFSRTQQSG